MHRFLFVVVCHEDTGEPTDDLALLAQHTTALVETGVRSLTMREEYTTRPAVPIFLLLDTKGMIAAYEPALRLKRPIARSRKRGLTNYTPAASRTAPPTVRQPYVDVMYARRISTKHRARYSRDE